VSNVSLADYQGHTIADGTVDLDLLGKTAKGIIITF
jgi:hypothetical protein